MTRPPAPRRPAVPILQFLGAAGTVTGSRFLLDTPRARVLVDCGLFQGIKELRLRNWAGFPIDPGSIDALLLTHAHIDHSGFIPALVKLGFRDRILATSGTHALARIMLPDSGHLQEEDATYANRKGFSKHAPALPLYTEEDAWKALERFAPVPWDEPVEVAAGVRASFHPAGHILGSAIVVVDVDGADPRRVAFSGDLGRSSHPLLRPPEAPPACHALLLESTYGDRDHQEEDALERLASVIARTAGRGGTVVMPAFAVDRTEVVLWHLRQLMRSGRVPPLPVFVDSPLASAALALYRQALVEGSPDVRPGLAADGDPFDPGRLVETRTVDESKALNEQRFPSIVISASGMATGGRVLHHLARRLPDPRNAVVLPGYQAAGTRGRLLAEGAHAVKMLGRYVPVRAEVVDLGAFSVHADRSELLRWVASGPRPGTVFVVHGESQASASLQGALETELGVTAAVARDGERVRLD
jgi:metallo-beta-lactamase family protein